MRGVNKDDLVVLVNTVLVDPVRVKDTQVAASATNTLLGGAPQAPLGLQLVDTLADGLAVGGTLGDGLLAVTATDTDTVDNVSLLGLVAETAGLVGARGAGRTVDDVELAVLPAAFEPSQQSDLRQMRALQHTERGGGIGGRPTASFCRAPQCTCTRPSCWQRTRLASWTSSTTPDSPCLRS